MFRFLFMIFFIVLLFIGGYFWLGRSALLSKFFSEKLNKEVSIQHVEWSEGQLKLKKLKISNPQSKITTLLEIENITIALSPMELFRKRIHIESVILDQVNVTMELLNQSGKDNNWTRFLNDVPPPDDKEKSFEIKQLDINNTTFSVRFKGEKTAFTSPKIPHVEYKNLGSNQPLSLSYLFRITFDSLLFSITLEPKLGHITDNLNPVPKEMLKDVKSNVQLDIEDRVQEGLQLLKRKFNEAGDYFQDLFARKSKSS